MLTPNELVLTFGGCYLCATFEGMLGTTAKWVMVLQHAKVTVSQCKLEVY